MSMPEHVRGKKRKLFCDAHEQIALVPAVVLEQPDADILLFCHSFSFPAGSVCRRSGGIAGHALDAHHVLLHQTLGSAHPLPAHRGALVQRIVAVAQLLDDVLQAAAFQLGDAVGVGAQHEGTKDGQTLRTGSVLPDLRLAGLDEAARCV